MSIYPSFAIIGYDDLNQPFANIGTGFFINSKAYFVTAAHTFKIEDRTYFAVLNKRKYDLEILYREYEDMENQKFPYHQDLIIGRINGITNNPYYALLSQTNLQKEEIIALGFARAQYGIIRLQSDAPTGIYNHDNEDISLTKESSKSAIEDDLKQINFSQINGNFTKDGLHRIYLLGPSEELSNGFRFQLETPNISPAGLSGGPILKNSAAIGMLISKDAAISSSYIAKKLVELNIEFVNNKL